MRLATIKEVSALLKVKTSTLYSWVNNHTIPFHKLNGLIRFDLDEIENWVKSSRIETAPPPRKVRTKSNIDIDRIVRRAIDTTKGRT
jgi:excisionase family DNA binding protein